MKKYSNLIIAFVLWILFLLFYKLGIPWVINNEASYKMNWVEPRYVKTFRYTPIQKVKSISNSNINAEKQIYFNKLKKVLSKMEDWFNWLKINENIYIYIEDLANAGMTIKIVDWHISLSKTIDESIVSTIVFKINKEDIDGMEYFISDGTFDKEEQLKIADVLMVWMIENLYKQEILYKASDMSMFKFDDFIHFEIKTEKDILRAWKLVDLNVSVFNVDWQWIVKKWLVWDPDLKVSITLEEAFKHYKGVCIDLKNAKTKKEAIIIGQWIFDVLIPNITYVRKDHK